MVREIDSYRLTDSQLEALGVLSFDCGLTNRNLNRQLKATSIPSNLTEQELNKALEKIEKAEGIFWRDVTGPLLEKGIIYQIKGKYPNKLLYINKFIGNMNKIQEDLTKDPHDGWIWYYDKIHYIEEKKSKLGEERSEEHVKAHGLLTNYIHLYLWCNKIKKEIDDIVQKHGSRYGSFCLISPCRIQDRIRIDQFYQEKQIIQLQQERFLDIIRKNVQHG